MRCSNNYGLIYYYYRLVRTYSTNISGHYRGETRAYETHKCIIIQPDVGANKSYPTYNTILTSFYTLLFAREAVSRNDAYENAKFGV